MSRTLLILEVFLVNKRLKPRCSNYMSIYEKYICVKKECIKNESKSTNLLKSQFAELVKTVEKE